MGQIILNYLFIFAIPLLFGFAIRFLGRSIGKAYMITVVVVGIAAIAWIIAWVVPSHGSEQNALLAVQASCAAAASLLTGAVVSLKRKFKAG